MLEYRVVDDVIIGIKTYHQFEFTAETVFTDLNGCAKRSSHRRVRIGTEDDEVFLCIEGITRSNEDILHILRQNSQDRLILFFRFLLLDRILGHRINRCQSSSSHYGDRHQADDHVFECTF